MKIKTILSALLLMVSTMASAQYLNVKLEDGTYHSYKTTPNMKVSFGDALQKTEQPSQIVHVNGHQVTVKLADDILAKDVLLYAYADNDMVKIDACSKSEYEFQCTRNDGEEVPAPAVSNGVYTFTITDITKDVVATICYRSCTISFNNNGHGTETESQEVMEGLKISRPEDPIADGLLFVGWYEEPECKTAWNFVADLVKKDMVLYAKWVEDAIPGVFTVAGPNGQSDTEDVVKVVFSKGNLQAHYNGSGYNWTFASNQYEYIGNNKGNTTIDGQTNGAIVDLFVWTASGGI